MSAPAVALTALALLSGGATAAQSDAGGGDPINPCNDQFLQLKCPDLRMAPPTNLSVVKAGHRLRLRATNRIVNVGQGPLELRGERTNNPDFAKAYQVVYTRDPQRPVVFFPEAGWIYWKAIPGQGHYWKYFRAARFELWTLNPDGTRNTLRRIGPKLSYCFRDLSRVRRYRRTPRGRVYPGCSQDFGRRNLRLGISPGWADIYPSTYHENWISITGLKGCFAFVHRADPASEIVEEHNDNNLGERIIRLPPRHGSVAPRHCPRPR